MRKLLLAATGMGLLLATRAQAAETTGTVRSVNTKSDSITLSDGKVYSLPEGIEAESVKTGERVKIIYSQSKVKNQASSLTKLK
jgi:Protein of unknown function (DUF1344)